MVAAARSRTTCRNFGISRQTSYCWQRRYDPYDLTSLEEPSHRPRQCRQPTWGFFLRRKGFGVAVAVVALGQRQAGGSATPQKLLVSVSMVGRILTRLKRHDRLV